MVPTTDSKSSWISDVARDSSLETFPVALASSRNWFSLSPEAIVQARIYEICCAAEDESGLTVLQRLAEVLEKLNNLSKYLGSFSQAIFQRTLQFDRLKSTNVTCPDSEAANLIAHCSMRYTKERLTFWGLEQGGQLVEIAHTQPALRGNLH